MGKIKTHSGAKRDLNFLRMVRLSVLMLTSSTFLTRRTQSVREV